MSTQNQPPLNRYRRAYAVPPTSPDTIHELHARVQSLLTELAEHVKGWPATPSEDAMIAVAARLRLAQAHLIAAAAAAKMCRTV